MRPNRESILVRLSKSSKNWAETADERTIARSVVNIFRDMAYRNITPEEIIAEQANLLNDRFIDVALREIENIQYEHKVHYYAMKLVISQGMQYAYPGGGPAVTVKGSSYIENHQYIPPQMYGPAAVPVVKPDIFSFDIDGRVGNLAGKDGAKCELYSHILEALLEVKGAKNIMFLVELQKYLLSSRQIRYNF